MTIETANRLFELRKKHNLSQEELAEKLGVSRQAVSKWERSEASPDTDNLIALAKIYDLSLDELIYGEKEEKKQDSEEDNREDNKEDNKEKSKESTAADDADLEIDFDNLSVDVDDGESKVKIGPSGILVEKNDGKTVKVDFNGIKINGLNKMNGVHIKHNPDGDDLDDPEDIDDDDDDENDEDYQKHSVYVGKNGHVKISVHEPSKTKIWLEVPYAIICTVAYLLCGFYNYLGGWHPAWVIFVTIPIYYSLVEAIYKKRLAEFAYPVLTAFLYLVFGLYYGNWHPSWIIFVTIPIYYPIAEAFDRYTRERREARENKVDKN